MTPRRGFPCPVSQAGTTLIEALVALGLLGILVVGFSALQGGALKALKFYEYEGRKEDLKNNLRLKLGSEACYHTLTKPTLAQLNAYCGPGPALPAVGAAPNKFIALLDTPTHAFLPRVVGAATPLRMGDFLVKARCAKASPSPSPNYWIFGVEALAVESGTTTPQLNPLTGKPAVWEQLFKDFPLTCELPKVSIGFKETLNIPNVANYGKAYSFANWLIDPASGDNSAGLPDDTPGAKAQICAYLNMQVGTFVAQNWASCSDNVNVMWNGATKRWNPSKQTYPPPLTMPHCPGGGSGHAFVESMTCKPQYP